MHDMSRLLSTIQRHMSSWQDDVETGSLYELLSRAIAEHTSDKGVRPDLIPYLYAQLDAYSTDPAVAPQARLKAGLLQHHISAYLPDTLEQPGTGQDRFSKDGAATDADAATITSSHVPASPHSRSHRGAMTEAQPASGYRAPWETLEETLKDLRELKRMWAKSLIDLIKGSDSLEKRLAPAAANEIESSSDHKKTSDHAPFPADKVVGESDITKHILMREFFLRQLKVEIERSKRHDTPLALALVGVDRLTELDEKYGPDFTASVHRKYQQTVLTNFRVYDLITQFDDNRYALLFPDTDKQGALRALEKARKRAQESYLTHDTDTIRLPGFVGGLTTYDRGETYEEWMTRTQAAYARAQTQTKTNIVSD